MDRLFSIPLWLSVSCVIATGVAWGQSPAARSGPRIDRVMPVDPPRAIGDFELTDQEGRPFRLSRLHGAPVLVFFGFAHCPDVCPAALVKLKRFRESQAEDLRRVQVVMVSVDGERDTPAALKAYLSAWSSDFVGLTGDPEHVREIAGRFSAVFWKGPARGASGFYLMDHSSQVFVVDGAGRLRAELWDPPVETIATLVRAVLDELR
jgi:protein SCO1/2